MSRPQMYRIPFQSIVDLPPGRERAILARKALAAFFGNSTTASLKSYGYYEEEAAVSHLQARLHMGVGWVGIPVGYEPKDSSDTSKSPVSLERHVAFVESLSAPKQ